VIQALDAEPACPGPDELPTEPGAPSTARLIAVRRPFEAIDRATWDALADRNPWFTPFSHWAFQRAWWDAYGENAHEQTLVVVEADRATDPDAPIVGIAPLMHRHEVEPGDEHTRTRMRHAEGAELTPVAPGAKAVFMGASYHADYATVLAAPSDMPAVAETVVAALAAPDGGDPDHPKPWDVIDLRRLRCGDPATDELAAAFGRREMAAGWTVNLEREDVSPVLTLPEPPATAADLLARLGKKERHEIRRKLHRAVAAGGAELVDSSEPLADLDAFIALHQSKWGADGLFPDTAGGAQSRVFFRRLFELFGPDGELRLGFLTIGGRRVAAGIWFDDGQTIAYYNAGTDPAARELSPGILLIARLAERAIELGRRRLDFLRGNETYKYEWGAVDEPVQRLLVRRTGAAP
jgi:CelD/BcsL family acetyltransferase involved in cellulose biosynthesis